MACCKQYQEALAKARLYGIIDSGYCPPSQWRSMAEQLVSGGAQILQIRAKGMTEDDIKTWSKGVASVCEQFGVPWVINDKPHVAQKLSASGAHVGQDDLLVENCRQYPAMADGILGKSTHSLEQAKAADLEDVDYLGFGPLFQTPTKPDYIPIGLDDIGRVAYAVSKPFFCIGGIHRDNLKTVCEAGARRVVIVSKLLLADDPAAYAEQCRDILESYSL